MQLNADPSRAFRVLREQALIYHDAVHDFYALSRFDDVSRALVDCKAFSSAKGAILELIKANIPVPAGVWSSTTRRSTTFTAGCCPRCFTPRKIAELEPKIREFCAACLDPAMGTGSFDFVEDLGATMPMKAISMLIGIPESSPDAA
ncbi:hypothetical protein A5685_15775 [Mycobacterium colombiense]|uniref:Uncharacterized protein n=1 Tax=Mycobacterium colombiense TaxID=339268 RepID=A0A1A2RJA2_9MYCO|nr:hypothetical protein A5685_15775 [Mycobacterium colombiense]